MYVCIYIYIYTHTYVVPHQLLLKTDLAVAVVVDLVDHLPHLRDKRGRLISHFLCFVFDSEGSYCGPDGMPGVVLWRLEALDCRVLIHPEA